MANAVFTTKINPAYDDLPEFQYHFPGTYLNFVKQAVGDWIIYYEPRREDMADSGRAGRQCYFATAFVQRVERDPAREDHYYAYLRDYQDFPAPVSFKSGFHYHESRLKKADGSTNKGAFGRAVRLLPAKEYMSILQLGYGECLPIPAQASMQEELMAAEESPEYGGSRKIAILERPVRDAAFTKTIQTVYQSRCAMTGLKLINGGGRCEIEAAHIRPVAADGPDSTRNGIALSRTVHWMFDRGILSIDDDGAILMAKRLVPDPVRRMLNPGGRVAMPQNRISAPHPVFLRYHRENVYKGD